MKTPPVTLALWLFSFPALAAPPRVLDRLSAMVNEEMIPLSEVYQHAAPEIARLEREGTLSEERKQAALKRALDDLIADKLLVAEEKAASVEVTEQEVDFAVEDVKKQNNMDAATFERALAAQGTAMAAYREKMR